MLNWLNKTARQFLISDLRKVFLVGFASRILVFVSAIIGMSLLGTNTLYSQKMLWNVDLPLVNLFAKWDSGCYANIALNGYSASVNPVDGLWCFFPLYPFLMRNLGAIFFGMLTPFESVLLAGFLISNILFFVSLIIFYKLSQIILKNSKLALISTVFFAFWPGSLFYSSVYTESLFMTLALGAFYFLEKEKPVKSTLLGFFAGLTRSNGFLVSIPFLYDGLQKRKKP